MLDIELTNKTCQDFLDPQHVHMLLDAGIDMSDAKYCVVSRDGKQYVMMKDNVDKTQYSECLPTYSTSELLYKIPEYLYIEKNGEEYSGGFKLSKDAPFYPAYFSLHNKNKSMFDESIQCCAEYPILSLAYILIQCVKHGHKIVQDISSK